MSPKDIQASERVESISIKKPERHKTYLDVLDISGKIESKRRVRGEGGEIAVANKAFQQTLPRRRSTVWMLTCSHTNPKSTDTHTYQFSVTNKQDLK